MNIFAIKLLSKIAPSRKWRRRYQKQYQWHLLQLQNEINVAENSREHISLTIHGSNNSVNIGELQFPPHGKLNIEIYGNNNHVELGNDVYCDYLSIIIGQRHPECPKAYNTRVTIGDKCSFQGTSIFTSHANTSIEIGERCMFSLGIDIRHTDSHPIYELGSTQHFNKVNKLRIGNHVWIGWKAFILKNVHIADDCIVGAHAVVSKSFDEPHCAIAGNPAKVVRRNITWEKHHTQEYISNI